MKNPIDKFDWVDMDLLYTNRDFRRTNKLSTSFLVIFFVFPHSFQKGFNRLDIIFMFCLCFYFNPQSACISPIKSTTKIPAYPNIRLEI